MKSHPRSMPSNWRAYQNELNSADELDVITRRQAMRVIERADVDAYRRRRARMNFAAACIGIAAVGAAICALLAAL